MTKLPTMRRANSKPTHPCICGCGLPTKSTWHTGHDGRATGWALRIERGDMDPTQVPGEEVNGAIHMLIRRAGEASATDLQTRAA